MRLYTHGKVLDIFMYPSFLSSLERQLPMLLENLFGDAVKEVQLYDGFFRSGGTYMFADGIVLYYPLTVIFKKKDQAANGHDRIVWLKWHKTDGETVDDVRKNPFCVQEPVLFEIADMVPEAFAEIVRKRKVMWYDRSQQALHCSWKDFPRGVYDAVSQSFLDALGYQVTVQLREMVPQNKMTKNWWMNISGLHRTVHHQGWHYRPVTVLNSHSEALTVAVRWQEPWDIADDVTNEEIHFTLVDHCPGQSVQSFDELTYLLREGTYVFASLSPTAKTAEGDIQTKLKRILGCEVEFDASWPDMVCELHADNPPPLTEVASVFAKAIAGYNRWHAEPIHYVGDPLLEEGVVRISMDFGRADTKALEFLCKQLRKTKWALKTVGFC